MHCIKIIKLYCRPFLLTFDLNSQLLRGGDRHGVPGPSAGPGLRRDGQLHGGGLEGDCILVLAFE